MRLKRAHTKGWTSRITYIGSGIRVYSVSIFTDRKGLEWVRCQPREKPSHVAKFEGLPPVFLRRFEGSAVQRRQHKMAAAKARTRKARRTLPKATKEAS